MVIFDRLSVLYAGKHAVLEIQITAVVDPLLMHAKLVGAAVYFSRLPPVAINCILHGHADIHTLSLLGGLDFARELIS